MTGPGDNTQNIRVSAAGTTYNVMVTDNRLYQHQPEFHRRTG